MSPPPPVTVAELDRLAHKYRRLAALRRRREELEAAGATSFPTDEGDARRAEFRRLAHEFPGALRELDASRADDLVARAATLEALLARLHAGQPVELPGWVVIAVDYHATLRQALSIKLCLARRLPRGGVIDPSLAETCRRRHARTFGDSRLGPLTDELLALHLRPPGGRIVTLVWDVLAARHGRPRAELEPLVYPPRPVRP